MKFKTFIGVDVSKLTLDICSISGEGLIEDYQIPNDHKSLKSFFGLLEKKFDLSTVLVCAEHTGHYSNPLRSYCLDSGMDIWLESGAEIKLRSGVQRNKSDKIDAERIASYALRYSDKAKTERAKNDALEEAKLLLSERELYVKERAKYKAQIRDLKKFIASAYYKDRKKRMDKHLALLSRSIVQIDKRVKEIFKETEKLSKQKDILKSIDGVGEQVAVHTIVATVGFEKFSNGRQFACHAGVAPFSYSSGTSQRSRNKVSNRANKKLKTLFHMAALSAIQMKGEFRDYFERKLAEGKNKMTIINAVRAKIINRIFALIREDRKYEKNYIFTLQHP